MKTANQKLLKQLNEAFAKSDTNFILDKVTDNIRWTVIGDRFVEGKSAFAQALKEMEQNEPLELTISNIITHGKSASVNGTMRIPGENSYYAFCDVYKLNGYKNPKIKEMTSYVVEVREENTK